MAGTWKLSPAENIVAAGIFSYLFLKTLPPSVLLLSASGPHAKGHLSDLKYSIFPLRPVALLRPAEESFSRNLMDVDHPTESIISDDNFRQTTGGWMKAVEQLCEMSPLIIFDTRILNPSVLEEIAHIKQRHLGKTLFVVNDLKETGSLDRVGLRTEDHLNIVLAEEVVPITKRRFRAREANLQQVIDHVREIKKPFKKRHQLSVKNKYRLLDQLAQPREALGVKRFISSLLPREQITLLLDGLQHHPTNQVRANCIVLLHNHDLSEQDIHIIVNALGDCSGLVRQQAASFIGVRALQGKPINSAIPQILRILKTGVDNVADDSFEEVFAGGQLNFTLAAAVKATVGARELQIQAEAYKDMEQLRDSLERLKKDGRYHNDAECYLRALFPKPDTTTP
jgi:hypothetical protein